LKVNIQDQVGNAETIIISTGVFNDDMEKKIFEHK